MVKAYLRYELSSSWGVICSNSNVTYDRSGKLLITSSLENVSIWNPKQGVLVRVSASGVGMTRSPRWPGTKTALLCCAGQVLGTAGLAVRQDCWRGDTVSRVTCGQPDSRGSC